jgi:hypothetical protein
MSEEPPISKLKLAIVGHEKNGKSRLASTARKPILFHDFDDRSESLNGIDGVYALSYPDPGWPKQPTAANDFLTNVSKLEESLELSRLGFKTHAENCVRTQVIDSIVTMGAAFQRYALFTVKDIRREISIGSQKVFLPGGWDAWNSEMLSVENAILRLLALPTDTIIILHETAEEAVDSTAEKPKFTGRVGVFPVRYQRLIKYFNEVWRVKLTQSVVEGKSKYLPRVYPAANYEFDGATTMLLDSVEEPNIAAMIKKHEQKLLAAGKGPKALTERSPTAVELQLRK